MSCLPQRLLILELKPSPTVLGQFHHPTKQIDKISKNQFQQSCNKSANDKLQQAQF